MKLARTSLVLLGIQLAIVSSVAAKYLYQRNACPRVWTRAVAYDPEMLMRGRYISAQIHVDACSLVAAEKLRKPLLNTSRPEPSGEADRLIMVDLVVRWGVLQVKNGQLTITDSKPNADKSSMQMIDLSKLGSCKDARLEKPVDFYLSETAKSPFPLAPGQQLWVEVTIPPAGPPRPLGLAIKSVDGKWQPLNYR